MKTFKELTGYNSNKFVKVDHVFIPGQGSFYETKELARFNHKKTGNEVGLYIETYNHEGVDIYRERYTNVWD